MIYIVQNNMWSWGEGGMSGVADGKKNKEFMVQVKNE